MTSGTYSSNKASSILNNGAYTHSFLYCFRYFHIVFILFPSFEFFVHYPVYMLLFTATGFVIHKNYYITQPDANSSMPPKKQRLSHNHTQQSLFHIKSICISDQSLYKTLFFSGNAFSAFSMAVSQNFQSWTPSHSSYVISRFLLLHN